jgi:hypothetical protein
MQGQNAQASGFPQGGIAESAWEENCDADAVGDDRHLGARTSAHSGGLRNVIAARRYAPAILWGGVRGGLARRSSDPLSVGERKNMHAVTRRPSAAATAVLRMAASRAKTASTRATRRGDSAPPSTSGDRNTSRISPADARTARRNSRRGSQEERERGGIVDSC